MASCQQQQLLGLLGLVLFPLTGSHTSDLGPYLGSMSNPVMGERGRPFVASGFLVGGEELVGQLGPAEALEIHGQERHVGQRVDSPQPTIELQTIQDAGSVGKAEDV